MFTALAGTHIAHGAQLAQARDTASAQLAPQTQGERIDQALRQARGILSGAALLLGVSRTTLWRWQRALEARPESEP